MGAWAGEKRQQRECFTVLPFYARPHAEEVCRYAAHGARGVGERFPLLGCTAPCGVLTSISNMRLLSAYDNIKIGDV